MMGVPCENKLYSLGVLQMYHDNSLINVRFRVLNSVFYEYSTIPWRNTVWTGFNNGGGVRVTSIIDTSEALTLFACCYKLHIIYSLSKPISYLSFDWLLINLHTALDSYWWSSVMPWRNVRITKVTCQRCVTFLSIIHQ